MNSGMQVDPNIAEKFAGHLNQDETILWTGEPSSRHSISILPILIAVVPLIFGLFVFRQFIPMFKDLRDAPGIFRYFPLIIVGGFIISFLLPVLKAIVRFAGARMPGGNKTYYAVTNKRALVLNTARGEKPNSMVIAESPRIDKWVNKDGNGYVVLGDIKGSLSSLATMSALGLDKQIMDSTASTGDSLVFMNIPNAEEVYNLVREQVPAETLAEMEYGGVPELAPEPSDGSAETPPALYLPPPPRSVPWYAAIVALFGNCSAQFGWLLLGVGLIFVWIFSLQADFTHPVFWGGVTYTNGKILASQQTNYSENESPIYRIAYTYTDSQGNEHRGFSYANWQQYRRGDVCTIEIAKLNPSLSRVQGTRRAPVGMAGLIPIVFSLLGLLCIVWAFGKGISSIRLLKNGHGAYARYTRAKKASDLMMEGTKNRPRVTAENDKPVYRLYYKFRAIDGRDYEAYTDSSSPESFRDDNFEMVVYDQSNPEKFLLLHTLPGKITLGEDGSLKLTGGSPFSMLCYLIIPSITLIGHGLHIYDKFLK